MLTLMAWVMFSFLGFGLGGAVLSGARGWGEEAFGVGFVGVCLTLALIFTFLINRGA